MRRIFYTLLAQQYMTRLPLRSAPYFIAEAIRTAYPESVSLTTIIMNSVFENLHSLTYSYVHLGTYSSIKLRASKSWSV